MRRALRSLLPIRGADIVHSLDVDLPLNAVLPGPLRGVGPRSIATVHDLAVFDVPWAFPGRRAALERMALTLMLRNADELLAVSQFTADRIGERFGRIATVTPLAPRRDLRPPDTAAIASVRALLSLPDRFVLHVGTIEPRKDVRGLAAACRRLGIPLVTAGAGKLDPSDAGGVHALGYVDEKLLPALYGAATVVAYPSRYEGFGLPPVEAMACGAAVVVTAVGALPELAPRGFPLVRPDDPADLAEHLAAAVNDDQHNALLRQGGAALIAPLSWEATADKTADVYAKLIG